jgi:hypothetical protein
LIGKKFRFDIILPDETGDMKKSEEAGRKTHDQNFGASINQSFSSLI